MSTETAGRAKIKDVTFAFLDVETTGLSSGADRICEVAVLRSRGGKKVDFFSSLIHPERAIPPEAEKIHGISDAMVASSPPFFAVAGQLYTALEGSVIVCHNAPFDMAFVKAELERSGLGLPPSPVLDTLLMARRHFRFESNRLGAIARHLKIESGGWHRAGRDVEILSLVFESFLKEFAQNGADTLQDLMLLGR
ncbi:MAG: hypothetical protein A3G41_03160 [Elusimicrobia bacterium RIFCSPLOWO2_12_FULL_59_9]|nr:MAG: hypothetical protein A3G41_03160 [Elusimicrobia bacterium RIFCSPLOWO2_12_FULL_59_9]